VRSDIAPGGTSPDYELPDQDRATRRLSEIEGDDPMILTLARGRYLIASASADPMLSMLAVYAATGGIDFLVEAWLLARRRRHVAGPVLSAS
jgi:hypothetical protein